MSLMACGDDDGSFVDGGLFDGASDAVYDASVDAGPIGDAAVDGAPLDGGPDSGPGAETCGDETCGWCASKDRCLGASEQCAFEGYVGDQLCWSQFSPCGTAMCWEPELPFGSCRLVEMREDFSSGRFNVHRYSSTLPPGSAVTLELEVLAGSSAPALLVRDDEGRLLYGGDLATLDEEVSVTESLSGREGRVARVVLQTDRMRRIDVFVTGWSVVDGHFASSLPMDLEYLLRMSQSCPGTASESIGPPTSGGRLENGVRVMSHPGYIVANTSREGYYGTQETIDYLVSGFDAVLSRHPDASVVQVRDISVLGGGRPEGSWPHASHRSGRDVDVTYHLDGCDADIGCPSSNVELAEFDAEATWTLFEHWLALDVARFIFVDRALQEVLYNVAVSRGVSAAQLERWIQYPRTGRVGVIRHENGHRDHHHVRFHCPADDLRCVE